MAQLKTPKSVIAQVLSALTAGMGINAVTRLYGVSKQSIYRWQERLRG
jgi:transposase